MHTRGTDAPTEVKAPTSPEDASLGAAAKQVAEHASTLFRLEIELATLELKRKAAALAVGIGLALGAVVLLLYAFGFGLASLASGLATAMPMWAALLIVTGILLLVAAILALIGRSSIKKGTPPVPNQAIQEAKLTTDALRADGRS
jgi:hypothetical protein